MNLDQIETRMMHLARKVFYQFGLVFCNQNTNISFMKDYMEGTCKLIIRKEISEKKASQIMDALEMNFLYAFPEVTIEITRYGDEKICIVVSNREST